MPSRGRKERNQRDTAAIIVAAGTGRRLGRKGDKAFTILGGRPLLFYCLKALEVSPEIDRVVVVTRKGSIKKCLRLVNRAGFRKVEAIVAGGRRRQDSVLKGLSFAGESKLIMVHDAARPFLNKRLVARTVAACRRAGAAIAAVPVSDTVKKVVGGSIESTIAREGLWLAQTPQVFRREIIQEAFRVWAPNRKATDDAAMVRYIGKRVVVIEGDTVNIKITFASDLALAESILRQKRRPWD